MLYKTSNECFNISNLSQNFPFFQCPFTHLEATFVQILFEFFFSFVLISSDKEIYIKLILINNIDYQAIVIGYCNLYIYRFSKLQPLAVVCLIEP